MLLAGRNWEGGSEYRYGFNGKESDRETALGVEYLIYVINGGKDNLANKINPTNNADYIQKGMDWLNANVPGWRKDLDFTPSSAD